jgi:CheY-like chemotaxis protein
MLAILLTHDGFTPPSRNSPTPVSATAELFIRGTTVATVSPQDAWRDQLRHRRRDMNTKNILLIEDDPKSRYAIQTVLEDLGHSVQSFSSAEEAVEASNHFDAAIIDIRLPHQQGPDFAIQFQRKKPDIHIIFITAYDGIPHVRQAVPGCVVLVKPIDMATLTKLL